MPLIIETERLYLKVFEENDIEQMKTFWGDGEVMAQCLGAVPHEQLTAIQEAYASCHEKLGLSVYAVVEKESGAVIGAAGFNVENIEEPVELIFHFAKRAWGKGYATEAANACLQLAKNHPAVKKVFASADLHNFGSLKILKKVGLNYKGLKWFEDTKQEEAYYELEF